MNTLKNNIKTAVGITAFIALISFNPTGAHADPGDGGNPGTGSPSVADTRLGTGSAGAPIDKIGTGSAGAPIDKIGNGSPDYSKPTPKPTQGKDESNADYNSRVGAWRAGESARIENLRNSKGPDRGRSICSTDKTSPNYCPVAGDDE